MRIHPYCVLVISFSLFFCLILRYICPQLRYLPTLPLHFFFAFHDIILFSITSLLYNPIDYFLICRISPFCHSIFPNSFLQPLRSLFIYNFCHIILLLFINLVCLVLSIYFPDIIFFPHRSLFILHSPYPDGF